MIDRETVRNHYKRYHKGGLPALQKFEVGGSESFLNELQRQALDQHLHEKLYLTAKEIAHYVEQTWGVSYSESGITQLLCRMGYVYKKPKLVPGKADTGKQRVFVECYEKLKASKAPEDPIYFMDATHPHHNPVAGYGWIKRGQDREIQSNTGRQRLNIIQPACRPSYVMMTPSMRNRLSNCFSKSRHTIQQQYGFTLFVTMRVIIDPN